MIANVYTGSQLGSILITSTYQLQHLKKTDGESEAKLLAIYGY